MSEVGGLAAAWKQATARLGAQLMAFGMKPSPSDIHAAAIAFMKAPVGEHGWRPIETAPEDGTLVLLHWSQVSGFDGTTSLGVWSDTRGDDPDEDWWYSDCECRAGPAPCP